MRREPTVPETHVPTARRRAHPVSMPPLAIGARTVPALPHPAACPAGRMRRL